MKTKKIVILFFGLVTLLGLVLVVTRGRQMLKNDNKNIETQQDLFQETEGDEEENELPIISPSSDKEQEESETANDNNGPEKKEDLKEENTTLGDKNKMELPFVPAK